EERYRVLKDPEEIRELHERIVKSDYRQTYHIQPPTGLLNDPNGFVWHDGVYNLFYQWCPWGAVYGLKYWYHTCSRDLVNWYNVGVCIKPDCDMDNKGIYSGSAWPGRDAIHLFYTGNHRDEDWKRTSNTCMVKLYDDGRNAKLPWPLFGPNPNYTEHQRDPKLYYHKERNKYYILLGAQTKDKHGCIIIYESDTLSENWDFIGELKVPGYENFGDMWECPAIEHIGNQDVLLLCPQHLLLPGRGGTVHHSGYLLGVMDWDTLTFHHDGQFHVLDFGFDSYAAGCANHLPDSNKAICTAWMGLPDASYPTDEEEWSGCLTLPRELRIRDRRLIQQPIAELAELRDKEIDVSDGKMPRVCELLINIRQGDASFRLFTKADGSGGISIEYDDTAKKITIDRSGLDKRFNVEQGESRSRPLENGLSQLRIFIDKSSMEIFVNDGDAVFTTRVFPNPWENEFRIKADCDMKIWSLKPSVMDDFIIW
ncbi:MAG: sucrose-6-phosphate hydrolase, partial [Lachnospiraceae bacterium]|nr:sucrose-6-phosphate hydrolase [Lachnospiraceae bacterium]